jgi:hypothetical protein
MAASSRFRAAGLGHDAVQRDRQPAYYRVAQAEFEAQTLRRGPVVSFVLCFSIYLIGCEEMGHFGFWRSRQACDASSVARYISLLHLLHIFIIHARIHISILDQDNYL